uniref:Uncharacterized protein n=1 Tax=Romanomermis culicivorax TaxID=13658 RepID=A0A915JGG8_ROMCU
MNFEAAQARNVPPLFDRPLCVSLDARFDRTKLNHVNEGERARVFHHAFRQAKVGDQFKSSRQDKDRIEEKEEQIITVYCRPRTEKRHVAVAIPLLKISSVHMVKMTDEYSSHVVFFDHVYETLVRFEMFGRIMKADDDGLLLRASFYQFFFQKVQTRFYDVPSLGVGWAYKPVSFEMCFKGSFVRGVVVELDERHVFDVERVGQTAIESKTVLQWWAQVEKFLFGPSCHLKTAMHVLIM